MIQPIFIDLKRWAASLVIDFPGDNIPMLYNEKEWKTWGNFLIQETSFANNGAPGTASYSDWREWAREVYKTMLNY